MIFKTFHSWGRKFSKYRDAAINCWRKYYKHVISIFIGLFILFIIGKKYGFGLTEIKVLNDTSEDIVYYQPAKTLWDFLEVVFLPVFVALVIYFLDTNDKKNKQYIADEDRKQAALMGFIDRVSDLILTQSENLNVAGDDNADNHVREMIHARLLEVVKGLDGNRKAQLIEFLRGLDLLTLKTIPGENDQDAVDDNSFDNQELPQQFPTSLVNGVDFSRIKLSNTELLSMELSGIIFKQVNFQNVNLSNCQLQNVSFEHAHLENVYFDNASMRRALFCNAKLEEVYFLDKADLRYSQWQDSQVSDSQFNAAYLEGTNFSNSKFTNVKFIQAQSGPEDLGSITERNKREICIENATWTDIDFTGAQFEQVLFSGTQFVGETKFIGTRLINSNFAETDLQGCDFRGAVLTGSVFREAKLNGATLIDTDFSLCQLHDAVIDEQTDFGDRDSSKWFLVWQLVNGQANKNKHLADLVDSNLSGAFLAGFNMQDCKLFGAILSNASLIDANLSRAKLYDESQESTGFDTEKQTRLDGANLNRCILINADLRHVILDGADLSGANLSGANFLGASLNNAKLHNTIIDEDTRFDPEWKLVWQVVNSELEGIDLVQESLSDANLEGADLSNQVCSGTRFNKSNLRRVLFQGSLLDGASFQEAVLDGADFTNAIGLNVELVKKKAKSCKGTIWPA